MEDLRNAALCYALNYYQDVLKITDKGEISYPVPSDVVETAKLFFCFLSTKDSGEILNKIKKPEYHEKEMPKDMGSKYPEKPEM